MRFFRITDYNLRNTNYCIARTNGYTIGVNYYLSSIQIIFTSYLFNVRFNTVDFELIYTIVQSAYRK